MPGHGWDTWGSSPEEQRRKREYEQEQRAKGKDPDKGGCIIGALKAASITALAALAWKSR